MAKTIHTDKAPAAIGPYVQGEILSEIQFIYDVNYFRKIISSDFFNQRGYFENYN